MFEKPFCSSFDKLSASNPGLNDFSVSSVTSFGVSMSSDVVNCATTSAVVDSRNGL